LILGSCFKIQLLLTDSRSTGHAWELLQTTFAAHGTAWHGTAQHSTAQHSTAQHSTAQHSTAQHSSAQHSTAQHSSAQHSSGLCLLGKRLLWAAVRIATFSMLLVPETEAGSLDAHATVCTLT